MATMGSSINSKGVRRCPVHCGVLTMACHRHCGSMVTHLKSAFSSKNRLQNQTHRRDMAHFVVGLLTATIRFRDLPF
jgi:hypothetical protein